MRDHLEGVEKEAKPVPDPNWLGCATAVASTEAAVVGVDDLLVAVRTAAVLVLEHTGIRKVFTIYENGDKQRTRWQW